MGVDLRRRLALPRGPLGVFTLAHVIAAVGDAFVAVSMAGSLFFNLSPEASRSQVLLYLSITMVPFAVLAPFVGPTIDRFRRGDSVVASAFLALRALCALGLAFTLFELSFYVLALALLITSKASGVVRQALVPRLVPDHSHLVEANSSLARVGTVAGGVAGATGAWMLSVTGAPTLLMAASGLFALAALVALRVRTAETDPPPPDLEYAELHTPIVLGASSGLMALRAGVGYYVFMVGFALRREGEPAWVFGLAVAAYGAGSFLGNVIAPPLRRRFSEHRLMGGALVAAALVAAIGVLGINRRSLALVSIVFGLAATVGRQAFDSLLQRSAPDALRARVFAGYETRFQLTWVLGGVLATAITLPVEIGMAVLAVLFIPVVMIYLRGSGAALRFTPAAVPDELVSASTRLVTAEAWSRAGNRRLAVVEAAATVDLALAAEADIAWTGQPDSPDTPTSPGLTGSAAATVVHDLSHRLAVLRRRAVDPAGTLSRAEVDEAIGMASAALDIIRSVQPNGRSSGSQPRPG